MLYFVTGNKHKIDTAKRQLSPQGIIFEAKSLSIIEIQSHTMEDIAKDKAEKAFAQLKQPLIIKDDGWFITALNGFPGPYMRYINEWFTSKDFLNLMQGKENREVIFHEVLYYIDKNQQKSFTAKAKGNVLKEVKGTGLPSNSVFSFKENGTSIAECTNQNIDFLEKHKIWNDFARWYKQYD